MGEIMERQLREWRYSYSKQSSKHILNDSRWALCNESDEEVHVVDEGVIVRAGHVFGLMFVSSCSVIVHIDDTILHASNIAQILWKVLRLKGVFPILWRSCENYGYIQI